MSNWKIGVFAGAVAGVVAGLANSLIGIPIIFGLGFHNPYALMRATPPLFTTIISNEIINNLIWGIILGVIYSRVYRVIPGKTVLKGLAFGLFGYLIYHIYFAIILAPTYIHFLDFVVFSIFIGPLNWFAYGLVLGALYEFLRGRYGKEEPEVIEYDMRGGVLPGAIAGLLSGLATFFTIFMSVYTGLWPVYPPELIDTSFILSQIGTQIMIHLISGLYIGAVFPKVYNLVPGKGILKGLYYGVIVIFLLSELRLATMLMSFGEWPTPLVTIVTGIVAAIVFGIVLGLLYRKPSE